MKFLCDETGYEINLHPGCTVYLGTRKDGYVCTPLSMDVIEKVPTEKRLTKKRNGDETGFDIMYATAPDFESGCSDDLGPVNHYFSVDEDTAKEYFPNHYERYYM